ncbi:MAG TPA: hypothetical protein VL128_17780 [Candidatus Eisenbacteria bacterium]|nr:hypothetical protein [Candidatus Eisenbacteria bacterium]
MLRKNGTILATLVAICLFAFAMLSAASDIDADLMAKRRVFPSIGPGLHAIHRGSDGKYYLLASPNVGIAVFDPTEKRLAVLGAPPAAPTANQASGSSITFGADFDLDSHGNLCVADRGSNLVKILAPDGSLHLSIPLNSPLSVAALPDGEIAVTSPQSLHLVSVFDSRGRLVREFGDPEPLSARTDLNRYASIGRLASDPQGHLYYGYTYFPEPLIRQFDSLGFAKLDFQLTTIDAFSEARATRKEIQRLEQRSDPPSLQPILTAFGIDPVSGDLWMALNNTLVHFDKDGDQRSEYRIYTPDGARLEANCILVEDHRLLIGADPLGVYEFARPDRNP